MEYLMVISLVLAVLCLLWAGWIDLKLWILPNELMVAVAFLAFPFYVALDGFNADWLGIVSGGLIGGGSLLLIRAIANRIYGMETLGLGDVKLMAATGLWLGGEGILMALSVGALCGVMHAMMIVVYRKFVVGQAVSMTRMALPAGPGFIAGSLIVGVFLFKELWS